MDVKITDNSEIVKEAMLRQLALGLKAVGMQAESHAKAGCPVDTGRLRNSITHVEDSNKVIIGTNVEYAAKQEYGDFSHSVGGAHYLRNAAADHTSEYMQLIKDALSNV